MRRPKTGEDYPLFVERCIIPRKQSARDSFLPSFLRLGMEIRLGRGQLKRRLVFARVVKHLTEPIPLRFDRSRNERERPESNNRKISNSKFFRRRKRSIPRNNRNALDKTMPRLTKQDEFSPKRHVRVRITINRARRRRDGGHFRVSRATFSRNALTRFPGSSTSIHSASHGVHELHKDV